MLYYQVMMNMSDTIRYWMEMSDYDLETARAMFKTNRYLYVGFMAHQAVEKVLKAYTWKVTSSEPPYTHDLWKLIRNCNLTDTLLEKYTDLIDELQPLNIEARYPKDKEELLKSLSVSYCQELLTRVEEYQAWIKAMC